MSTSARCPQCGLIQLAGPRCKSCGRPLPGTHAAVVVPPPLPPKSIAGAGAPIVRSTPRIAHWSRRLLIGIGWFIAFYCGGYVLIAVVAGAIAGANDPNHGAAAGAQAARAAVASLRVYLLLGAAALAAWGAWRCRLPGTRLKVERPLPPSGSLRAGRAFMIVGVFFGIQVLVGFLIGVGIGVYNGLQARHGGATILASGGAPFTIIVGIVGLLLGALVAFRLTRKSLSEVTGEKSLAGIGWSIGSRRSLLISTFSGFLLAAFYLLVLVPLFPPRPDYVGGPLAQVAASTGWPRHAWAVLVLFLAPPIEEFFFRGVLFAGICRSSGRVLAVVGVTALFAAFHVSEVVAYWPVIVAISLLGCGTMVVRIAAEALGPAIALHTAYNFALVVCVYTAAG